MQKRLSAFGRNDEATRQQNLEAIERYSWVDEIPSVCLESCLLCQKVRVKWECEKLEK